MTTAQSARSAVRALASRTGTLAALRTVHQVATASGRRDRKDASHLRCLLAWTLKEDSNCVDIGSYRGEVLAEIVRLAPRGRHIAFEPLPAQAERLRAAFPGVEVRNAAVSDKTGEAS